MMVSDSGMMASDSGMWRPDRSQWLEKNTHEIEEIPQYSKGYRRFFNSTNRRTGEKVSIITYASREMSWEAQEQFDREVAGLKKISHPNLPNLLAVEEYEGGFALVMDPIEGHPLSSVMIFRQLSKSELKEIGVQIPNALTYLHEVLNLGHGEIAPQNIWIRKTFKGLEVTVTEFGLSRLDGCTVKNPLSVAGAPGFLPQGQSCNPELRAEADFFGLGVTINCAWTRTHKEGASQFSDPETGEVAIPISAFGIHWYMAQWVQRLVSTTNPYRSAQEALADLERLEKRWQAAPFRIGIAAFAGVIIGASSLIPAYVFGESRIWRLEQAGREQHAILDRKIETIRKEIAQREAEEKRRLEEERQRIAMEQQRKRERALQIEQERQEREERQQQAALERKREAMLENLKRTRSCAGCNLQGMDLSSLDLAGAYLPGANLSESLLMSTNLEGANLSGANLTGTRFSNGNLKRVNFSDADMRGAALDHAHAEQACFEGADLRGADLGGANMNNSSFERAKIEGTWFGLFPLRNGAKSPSSEVWAGKTTAKPACP